MSGKIIQINVKPKTTNECGLPKFKVTKAKITSLNVGEDYNNYRTNSKHSTPDRAVLIYPLELINQLNTEGWPVKPADLGENITTSGIDYHEFLPRKKFLLGNEVIIEITEKCDPCNNLANLSYIREEKINSFIKTLVGRRGMYAKVLKEGMVSEGDNIEKYT
ncbi:MAG: MOSC domain-containing protein [Candidatus Thorarchaeota archaeon]